MKTNEQLKELLLSQPSTVEGLIIVLESLSENAHLVNACLRASHLYRGKPTFSLFDDAVFGMDSDTVEAYRDWLADWVRADLIDKWVVNQGMVIQLNDADIDVFFEFISSASDDPNPILGVNLDLGNLIVQI